MPDNNLADGSVFTSSFYNTNIREQVIATVTSSTRPTATEGRVIYETDTDKLMIYSGTSWNVLGGSKWVSFTPTWTNLSVGNATEEWSYHYVNGGIRIAGNTVWGSTTSASGTITMTVPNSETSRTDPGVSMGAGSLLDSGTRVYPIVALCADNSTSIAMHTAESSYIVNATNPFTFTTSDEIRFDITVALA